MLAVIVLVEFKPQHLGYGLSRFVLGRFPLRHVAGLRFSKLLGSGHEGGFGLKPSASRQGLFLLFDDTARADAFLQHGPLMAAYRARAQEFFYCKLIACSCKGSWAGVSLPVEAAPPEQGPIAALTRASIRPSKALAFWRNSPAAELSLASAQGCRIAVGLGEAPFFRQATFSIWDSVHDMNRYARSGAHLQAIQAASQQGHFAESMFARFVPVAAQGVWKGKVFR